MKSFLKKLLIKTLPTTIFDYIAFIYIFKKWPSLSHPTIFNEKVFLRKYFDRNYLYTKCADKYEVRDYVSNKIGDEYLVDLILVVDTVDELRGLEELDSFVIKSNHGAGMVKLVHNKLSKNEIVLLKNECLSWMEIDYSLGSNECQYAGIPKKILIERSLCEHKKPPRDYKFHCFNQKDGSVKFVLQLVNGRFGCESRGYYANNLDNCYSSHGAGEHHIPPEDREVLLEIIELNKKLVSDFNYVRIDWYVSNGKPYFGELTFTPGGGLSNEFGYELEKLMCSWWVK